jgi:hypothetical protein
LGLLLRQGDARPLADQRPFLLGERDERHPLRHQPRDERDIARQTIEAQRDAIARFAETEGLEVIAELVEVETGKGSDALERRPLLREALTVARKAKATICVARLVTTLGADADPFRLADG